MRLTGITGRGWARRWRGRPGRFRVYVPDCPLCPGNTRVSGARNPDYAGVFVFDNDMPCVGPKSPRLLDTPPGIYRNRPAKGIARVVCYTPRHDMTLAELDLEQVVALLAAWQEQYRDLGGGPR